MNKSCHPVLYATLKVSSTRLRSSSLAFPSSTLLLHFFSFVISLPFPHYWHFPHPLFPSFSHPCLPKDTVIWWLFERMGRKLTFPWYSEWPLKWSLCVLIPPCYEEIYTCAEKKRAGRGRREKEKHRQTDTHRETDRQTFHSWHVI